MKRKPLLIGSIIAIAVCAGIPTVGFAGYNVAYFVREQLLAARQTPLEQATPVPSPAVTPTDAPVCGGPPTMFVLLIGSDSRADSYQAGLADAIRVVRIDFQNPGISYLAFPARLVCGDSRDCIAWRDHTR